MPRWKFKNPDGPYFRLGAGRFRDFERVLTNANGIGDIIEAYLSRARPKLEGSRHSEALFISRTKEDAHDKTEYWPRLHTEQFARRLRDASNLYLAGGSPEYQAVEGAEPFTTHQCRAILCAGKLKRLHPEVGTDQALQLAADAIADGVEAAEYYYARWDGQMREQMLSRPN